MYVRDYPDFEFRAAADWLLNAEGNRWSMERGQGVDAYRMLCKQKLDQALRYKINMVLMDGFGWSLQQRFAGYADLMRDLNLYARARGIHLLFGGYGASYGITYQTGPLYEEGAYLGEVFKNRESYPDGPTYQCMGFTRGKKGVDPSILGKLPQQRRAEPAQGGRAEKVCRGGRTGGALHPPRRLRKFPRDRDNVAEAVRPLPEAMAQRLARGRATAARAG